MAKLCPLCGKELKEESFLIHLIRKHRIASIDELKDEIEKKEKNEKRRVDFRKYVEDLEAKIRQGELTRKDYRELVTKWFEEHR